MSSSHSIGSFLHDAESLIVDPGASGTITVNKSLSACNIVSTAAQSRTLARPTRSGVVHSLHFQTDGGDVTVTVTGGYDVNGATTLVFSSVGQFATFRSFQTSAGVYFWRLIEASPGITTAPQAVVLITTKTVTPDETGKTFYLDLAAGFVTTLPAVQVGLRYAFVVKTAPTGSYTIVCPAAATLFKGTVLTCDVNSFTDADFGTTGEATVTFVLNKALASDRVDVECDGVNWHVRASCTVFDAITIS